MSTGTRKVRNSADIVAGDQGSQRRPLPDEVREVADCLIATLGDNLAALLWHGSWARGEQTAESDHDLIIVLRQVNGGLILAIQGLFADRSGWSTYIKSEQELRQYPVTGRVQFQFGLVPLYGEFEAPPLSPQGLAEDIRLLATNIHHECRYLLVHGTRKVHLGSAAEFLRVRNARWMYYQAKLAILALKAREMLLGRSYPETRAELRSRLTDGHERAVVDAIDRWPELRDGFEGDVTPLVLRLDAVMRNLVAELDSGESEVKRHFTATGFVVDGACTMLHWHRRLQQWMPPGGHIELDEDPVQAVLREIKEETGLIAEVIPVQGTATFTYPEQVPAPYTILIEDIPGPGEPHKHIDMIYFCRPIGRCESKGSADQTLRWVSEDELQAAQALDVAGCGISARVPDDVRELALIAIEVGGQMEEISPKP